MFRAWAVKRWTVATTSGCLSKRRLLSWLSAVLNVRLSMITIYHFAIGLSCLIILTAARLRPSAVRTCITQQRCAQHNRSFKLNFILQKKKIRKIWQRLTASKTGPWAKTWAALIWGYFYFNSVGNSFKEWSKGWFFCFLILWRRRPANARCFKVSSLPF